MADHVEDPRSASRPEPLSWLMLLLGTLVYFCFGVVTTAIAVMVGPIREELGISYAQMGLILGSWQFMYIFSSLPIGLLIDRIGTKPSLLIGAVIMAASAIARGYATDFPTLLGAVALFGIGGPIISIGMPKLVSAWFHGSNHRGMAVALYAIGPGAGSALALAATNSVVIPLVGTWREVYIAYGLLTAAVALLWLFLGRETPTHGDVARANEATRRDSAQPSLQSKWAMLHVKPVRLVAFVGLMGFAISHGFSSWLPHFLELKGYTPAEAGYLSTIPRIAGMAGGVTAAYLVALTGSRFRVIAVNIMVLCVTLLVASVVVEILPLSITLVFLGMAGKAVMPLLLAVLMDLPQVGTRYLGSAIGIFFALGEIGGFGGPALIGVLYDVTGSFVAGITALAMLGAVTLWPLVLLKSVAPTAVEFRPTRRGVTM